MSDTTMKAAVYTEYGSPEVLKIKEVSRPQPKDNEILVRVLASSVNSADWRLRKADPLLVRFMFGLIKPKINILGVTFAGIVEVTGSNVSGFRKGDKIFGMTERSLGAHAEYVCLSKEGVFTHMPENLSFEEAAVIPFGATTALEFLKKAETESGKKVLVYGASGAVGTAAVQIAKHFGAEVTAVCSSANVDLVKRLGAAKVIDYTKDDVYKSDVQYDIIFETVDKADVMKLSALLNKNGTLILGSALVKGAILGKLISFRKKVRLLMGEAKPRAEDMIFLKKLIEDGSLKAVIDSTFPLEKIAEAHSYAESWHKKGNVAITISS